MNRTASSLKVFALTMALLSLLALSVGLAYGQAVSGNVVGTVRGFHRRCGGKCRRHRH